MVRLLPLVAAAVALSAATPRVACACSSKEGSYRAAMKSDLRNLVTAQEGFLADSGRLARGIELIGPTRWIPSTGVVLDSLTATASGWRARVSYPTGTTVSCWIEYRAADGAGEPMCPPYPTDRIHLVLALVYLGLIAVAFALDRERLSTLRITPSRWRLLPFALLLVAHPFWDPLRELSPEVRCWGSGGLDAVSVALAGLLAYVLYRRSENASEGVTRPRTGPRRT